MDSQLILSIHIKILFCELVISGPISPPWLIKDEALEL